VEAWATVFQKLFDFQISEGYWRWSARKAKSYDLELSQCHLGTINEPKARQKRLFLLSGWMLRLMTFRNLLRNFLVAGNYRKYVDQMQEISNRQRKVLEIAVDDLFDHKNDDEFVNNVKNNTCRYLRYFEEAADELLPAASVQNREKDVFDILQVWVALLLLRLDVLFIDQSIA
jgi:MCM N-terminal domain